MIKYIHDPAVHNLNAPKVIVPILMDKFNPRSVADVGCGIGTFLKVFNDLGVHNFQGFDGKWLNEKQLYVPREKVNIVDLETENWANGNHDLAICLEVAEHLNPKMDKTFVKNLTRLSDVIVFSAALEGQGGQNHINEKPFEAWIEIFNEFDYHFFDVFRKQLWNLEEVNWWYKQNMFLVVKKDSDQYHLNKAYPMDFDIMSFVHPDCLRQSSINRQILKNEYDKLAKAKSFNLAYIIKKKLKSLSVFFKS